MIERRIKLASGLALVEHVPDPTPEPPKPMGIKCSFCDRRSKYETMLPLMHRTSDFFTISSPTCRHPSYLQCPDCDDKHLGCPICGERCEYT